MDPRIEKLKAQRKQTILDYARARKSHHGRGPAGRKLIKTTLALLKAEREAALPKRGRPRNPRPAAPDLFQGAHA